MGLLDGIGKKGTDALLKARELSEIARINSLISQSESKVNNLYYQIGKLYVNKHGHDGEDEFIGMIDKVAEIEQQIADYQKQIQDIKGIQNCPKCGAANPMENAFCSVCGEPLLRANVNKPTNAVICPKCGAAVKAGSRFCTSCGETLNKVTPRPLQQVENAEPQYSGSVNEITPKTEAENKSGRVCPNCGAVIASEFDFCTECGTRL